MNRLRQVSESFSRWIDVVAATVHALLNRWSPQRVVRLTEGEQGTFALQAFGDAKDLILPDQEIRIADGAMAGSLSADWMTWLRGSRAEVILHPGRFMFRPLELPKRASEFLEGIVRSQIDRLTPWSANEAAYAWTPPAEAGERSHPIDRGGDRAVAGDPYVRALADLGAASVVVSTVPQDAGPSGPARSRSSSSATAARSKSPASGRSCVGLSSAPGRSPLVSTAARRRSWPTSLDASSRTCPHKIAARRAAMRRQRGRRRGPTHCSSAASTRRHPA